MTQEEIIIFYKTDPFFNKYVNVIGGNFLLHTSFLLWRNNIDCEKAIQILKLNLSYEQIELAIPLMK